ncbi:MAG: quercetin dioxygenase-like cupin family protein [Pseudohongiellaceae bacterium]
MADPEASIAIRSLALRIPSGYRIEPHEHTWPQLIHATDSVMTVDTEEGLWVIPPRRAAWVPGGVTHGIEATGQ